MTRYPDPYDKPVCAGWLTLLVWGSIEFVAVYALGKLIL